MAAQLSEKATDLAVIREPVEPKLDCTGLAHRLLQLP
jgi:hypothetical protein